MEIDSFRLSARTVIILIIYCSMIPLGAFFVISMDDRWSDENNYSIPVYVFVYTLLCFPLFAIFITYWIDDAYTKDLCWFLKRWWLICFLLLQLLCASLSFYLILFLVNETLLKSRWDTAAQKYILDTKLPTQLKTDSFINHMKNFFPLGKPPIFVFISLFLMNILIFALLLVYSVKHDLKKVPNSYEPNIESNSGERAASVAEEISYSGEKDTPIGQPIIEPFYLHPERTNIN